MIPENLYILLQFFFPQVITCCSSSILVTIFLFLRKQFFLKPWNNFFLYVSRKIYVYQILGDIFKSLTVFIFKIKFYLILEVFTTFINITFIPAVRPRLHPPYHCRLIQFIFSTFLVGIGISSGVNGTRCSCISGVDCFWCCCCIFATDDLAVLHISLFFGVTDEVQLHVGGWIEHKICLLSANTEY